MKKVVSLGEIMLRLSPPEHLRFTQATSFDAYYGGAEANVIISLAEWGVPTEFVTRLPENELGEACLQTLHRYGILTNHVQMSSDRLGIYFCEYGSSLRPSRVLYDRDNSAFSSFQPETVIWEEVFGDAEWFHWTGVTPAISQNAYQTLLGALKAARDHNLMISCDINFRSKLWKWGKSAQEILPHLVEYTDVFLGNVEDLRSIFNITIPEVNSDDSEKQKEYYLFLAEALKSKYPHIKKIALTDRKSISASHNLWSAFYWDGLKVIIGPKYEIIPIEDRVGGGDSFAAGLIYGLLTHPEDSERILHFALAASALKHTIKGDYNQVSLTEINNLMSESVTGRIIR
ncbi:MAG: sugar kinase [Anaerolineaceae bacterium]